MAPVLQAMMFAADRLHGVAAIRGTYTQRVSEHVFEVVETHPDAMAVPDVAVFIANAGAIAKVMADDKLPSVGFVNLAQVRRLIGYRVNLPVLWHRAAYFVDRILKGAKAADLPVQQPTKFELVINRKTAKVLGIAIPPQLLARADEVIE